MARRSRLAPLALLLVSCGVFATPASAAPPNDDFDDAIPVQLGQSIEGALRKATVEPGEMQHAGSQIPRTVWYRFRAKRDGLVDVSVCGPKFELAIGVFAGRSVRSLRTLKRGYYPCEPGPLGAAVRTRRGHTYSVAVIAVDSPTSRIGRGRFTLRLTPIRKPSNDDFLDAVRLRPGSTLSGTTAGSTGEPGEPRRCCGLARTVWYELRLAAAGHIQVNACNKSRPSIAIYTGRQVDALTAVGAFGFSCAWQFAVAPGVTYRVVADDRRHWGPFQLSARTVAPPGNDDFANRTPITLGTTVAGTTRYASLERGEPRADLFAPPFTVWYRLAVGASTVIEVDPSCGEGLESMSVYTGEQLSQLQEVSKEPRDASAGGSCAFRFVAPSGEYNLRAQADALGQGDFQFTTRAVQPPP